MAPPIEIVDAADADWDDLWEIILEVAGVQETFAMDAVPDEAAMRRSWMTPPPGRVILARYPSGRVLGTANMYANRPNQGAHVASGSLMVAAPARGRALVEP